MWADPPIRGLSTFAFGGPSGIPQRTEQVPSSSNNISTWITSPWCKCTQWWTHFLASGPLPVCNGRMWVQGPGSWQWFNIYFPHMPHHGTSPQSRELSQHDHGGQWTPIVGSSGHLWSSIGEFHPKKTSIHGPRSPIFSWAGRFCQTHGHLLSGITAGEHSRWCRAGQSDPWGDLCSPFPSSQNLRTWYWHPPWGCDSAPKGGKQGIRMPIGD